MVLYELVEIGIDKHGQTNLLTARDLITTAQEHCASYDDGREKYLPINTLVKALLYFARFGFVVVVVPECMQVNKGVGRFYKEV